MGFCAEGFAMLSITIAEHFCDLYVCYSLLKYVLLAIFAIIVILTMFTIVIVPQ